MSASLGRAMAANAEDDPKTNPLRDAALAYARGGWPVFPVRPYKSGGDPKKDNGKVPATKNGVKDATTDETVIRRWWADTPTANIGIACGPAGLLAVDLDVKEADGVSAWHELSVERVPYDAAAADREATSVGITQACTAILERAIRERPAEWVWMHRRWRRRPPEPPPGPVPPSCPARTPA